MATATKTKTTKPASNLSALRADLTATWRNWARTIAAGGALPSTSDLLEAATLLGKSIDDLERDAAYLRAYDAEIATRDRWQAALDKIEAERGPVEVIKQRIERLEDELRELNQSLGWGTLEAMSVGTARSKVERLRKQRPDLFDEDEA